MSDPLHRDDGTGIEADDADVLEQAQPLAAEPAAESLDRAATATPELPPQDELEGSVADGIEQRQEP
ncbi:hypothetical protein QDR37_07320 [Amnibacterium sp. CER49]|uniref:hypothetical protein n=1 Tax=Amnibacterium sp. CER49 TaxID=3039161 RepID=UPI002448226C|nr:hypothetical protein [Amnibacterium sp. CER49]MDH2443751.1 hypothetical protein [Amnibacterium sp. CER49]